MKQKANRVVFHSYFPFLILFILMLILHVLMNLKDGDYFLFEAAYYDYSLSDFLVLRYQTWSSRLLLDAILVELIALPGFVFKIIDLFVIVFVGVMLSKLFVRENRYENHILIVLLILIYRFTHMASAGWYATLVNYMWPLLCMLVAFMPVKNYLEDKQEKWYVNVLYLLSLMLACNQEQTVCIISGVYGLLLIDMIWKKKIRLFQVIILLIAIANLIFILNCPGNAVRTVKETEAYFPEFLQLGLI